MLTVVLVLAVILVHEAGHAVARALCARRAFTPLDQRVARLDGLLAEIDADGPWRHDTFATLSAARETAADALRVALAGPAASVGLGLAAAATATDVALVAGLTSTVYGLVCLLPFPSSDGRRALDARAALRTITRSRKSRTTSTPASPTTES